MILLVVAWCCALLMLHARNDDADGDVTELCEENITAQTANIRKQ